MENVNSKFYLLAGKHSWDASFQVEMLLACVQDNITPEKFQEWCDGLDKALTAETIKEADMPVTHEHEIAAFFDRDLTMQHIKLLDEMPAAQVPTIDGGNLTATIEVDAEYLRLMQMLIDDDVAVDDFPVNGVIGGWYYQFGDATAMVMVMNGDSVGGPYVDAVMVLPQDKFPTVAPESLEPRTAIIGEYKFDYPDGTTRTLRITTKDG